MGTYGILRISFPILPEATRYFAYPLAIMGAINIIYGALCCMAQTGLKKLVAYSSISHMGFVLLGMAVFTDAGINGAVLQMFNHGIISGMLFLLVGVIYDRAHHRDINGFGGLGSRMPIYTGFTSLGFFAGLGLPGLNGFISEVLVLIGAYPVYQLVTIVSTLGIILAAGYFLWAFQRMFLGPLNPKYEQLPEINGREIFTLVPLAGLAVFLGVYPVPVLDLLSSTLSALIRSI
jgi:NADH-quinone oxidoreductase subunit M